MKTLHARLRAAAIMAALALAGHVAPVLAVDPGSQQEYPCSPLAANYVWNDGSGTGNVSGRLYRPRISQGGACTNSWPAAPVPLVVLAHGNGFSHTAYTYLANHLAHNGFAVVSVSTGNLVSASDRADRLITYIHGMKTFYAGAANLSDDIALVGHSRGGEGVMAAAIKIEEQSRPWTVRAVVALAPTDAEAQPLNLTYDAAQSLLTVVASRDGDVVGACVGDHGSPGCSGAMPATRPGTGFTLYDRAGGWSRVSQQPTQWMTKAFSFLHGATHSCFSDQVFGVSQGPGTLGCGTQREVVRAMVNGFLRWRLKSDAHRSYFTGEAEFDAVSANAVVLDRQYQEFGPRVVDNFETGGWAVNTLGGAVAAQSVSVTESTLFQFDSVAPLNDHHFSVPHDGRGLRVHWNGSPFLSRWLRWDLPFAQCNVAGYEHLGLRAAQLYDSARNPGGTMSLRVILRDLDGGEGFVELADYGGLTEPESFNLVTLEGLTAQVGANYSKSAMRSFRIPLDHFVGVDFTRIARVQLVFSGGSGELIFDDVSFTH